MPTRHQFHHAFALMSWAAIAVHPVLADSPPPVAVNPRVDVRLIEYKDANGDVMEGVLAVPRNPQGKVPGVLVIHEWYGVNDYTRERTVQLAEAGYVAFAADLYGKGRRAVDAEGAGKLAGELKGDRLLTRMRGNAALQVLLEQPQVDPDHLAAIGYCFGGMAVLELARGGADVAGVVSFHGSLDTTHPAKPGEMHARVLVCHGGADRFVPAKDVDAIQRELTAVGADWQFITYSDAVHGFTNPHNGRDPSTGVAYNEPADRRSWALMLAFFGEIFAAKD